MSANDNNSSRAPGRLLSALSQWFSANGDHELARRLQISPQVLRQIRNGHVSVSPSLLLLMADASGIPVDELRVQLAERRRAARGLRQGSQDEQAVGMT